MKNEYFFIARKKRVHLNREQLFNEKQTEWMFSSAPRFCFGKWNPAPCANGCKEFESLEAAKKVFNEMRAAGINDLIIVYLKFNFGGIETYKVIFEIKYVIKSKIDGVLSCNKEFEVKRDAQKQMKSFVEVERKNLYIAEIEVENEAEYEYSKRNRVVDYAVYIVNGFNRIDYGLHLNDKVCNPKGHPKEVKEGFFYRAKISIFDASREQLEKAYDECVKAGCDTDWPDEIVEEMFKYIGNNAAEPGDTERIEKVSFGIV